MTADVWCAILVLIATIVLVTELIVNRIWKKVGKDWHGYGNGFHVVAYEHGQLEFGKSELTNPNAHVWVYKNDRYQDDHLAPNLKAAKQWAERNYLK